MLDVPIYLDALGRESAALANAARRDLTAPIPSCPGWMMSTLVAHLTGIYTHRTAIVRARDTENTAVRSYHDLSLPDAMRPWFDAQSEDKQEPTGVPDGLVELFEAKAAELRDVLGSVDPREPVWTWWPPDQTAGFWVRRMAQETAVHRWNAHAALGEPESIEPELARDGIDEMLDVMLPSARRWAENIREGHGETYHFHRTDGPGEWLVRFQGEGATVTREHAKGDVAVRGTASDLLLFLWGRLPAEQMEVLGDSSLLGRFFEFVPPN